MSALRCTSQRRTRLGNAGASLCWQDGRGRLGHVRCPEEGRPTHASGEPLVEAPRTQVALASDATRAARTVDPGGGRCPRRGSLLIRGCVFREQVLAVSEGSAKRQRSALRPSPRVASLARTPAFAGDELRAEGNARLAGAAWRRRPEMDWRSTQALGSSRQGGRRATCVLQPVWLRHAAGGRRSRPPPGRRLGGGPSWAACASSPSRCEPHRRGVAHP